VSTHRAWLYRVHSFSIQTTVVAQMKPISKISLVFPFFLLFSLCPTFSWNPPNFGIFQKKPPKPWGRPAKNAKNPQKPPKIPPPPPPSRGGGVLYQPLKSGGAPSKKCKNLHFFPAIYLLKLNRPLRPTSIFRQNPL